MSNQGPYTHDYPARALYGLAAERPDPQVVGDKGLFVACDEGNQLYQVQSGNWVKVPTAAAALTVASLAATGAVQSHSRAVAELGATAAGTITPDTTIVLYDSGGTPYYIPAKAV